MKLTQNQFDAFHRDGYIIVADLFNPDAMAAALRDMEHIFYGKSFAEYLGDLDKTGNRQLPMLSHITVTQSMAVHSSQQDMMLWID